MSEQPPAVNAAISPPEESGSVETPQNERVDREVPVIDAKLGSGDSYLVLDILPEDLASVSFQKLEEEVRWDIMHHRGGEVPRLVAVQGEVGEDGSFPIYRHPTDESPPLFPFSPTVTLIREHVQRVLNHPVNHVLIQFYRTGADYISEHSDKTIDVVRGSKIVNISLGAQRVMTLRMKKDGAQTLLASGEATKRPVQRFPLPHNSMFVMGPETNSRWLHAINHDKRFLTSKSEAERREGGARISLTFRHIGTFLMRDQSSIYGQGAKGKTVDDARTVVNGTREAEKLIEVFGRENHESDFDWEGNYGEGFDVLHFTVRD